MFFFGKTLRVGILLLVPFLTWGGEEVQIDISSAQPDTKKATLQATEQVRQQLFENLTRAMGSGEQKQRIQARVSELSDRYILYTKTRPPEQQADGTFLIPVTVGFSEKNLRQILLKEGLFYEGHSPFRILPLVVFKNHPEGLSYRWWGKQSSPEGLDPRGFDIFYNHLQNQMLGFGFYTLHPEGMHLRDFIPGDMWFDKPKKKSVFGLARFFNSDLVLTGTVQVKDTGVEGTSHLILDFSVYHTQTGRKLSQLKQWGRLSFAKGTFPGGEKEADSVCRLYQSVDLFLKQNPRFLQSVGEGLKSLYESGALDTYLLKITVQARMSYQNLKKFKARLVAEVPALSHLREHVVKSRSVTFFAQSTHPKEEVLSRIQNIPEMKLKKAFLKRGGIVLRL